MSVLDCSQLKSEFGWSDFRLSDAGTGGLLFLQIGEFPVLVDARQLVARLATVHLFLYGIDLGDGKPCQFSECDLSIHTIQFCVPPSIPYNTPIMII